MRGEEVAASLCLTFTVGLGVDCWSPCLPFIVSGGKEILNSSPRLKVFPISCHAISNDVLVVGIRHLALNTPEDPKKQLFLSPFPASAKEFVLGQ